VLTASRRLAEQEIPHAVVYLLEPGRFRAPRSLSEQGHQASPDVIARLFPSTVSPRLYVTHTRPETILGLLGPLHTGADTAGLGYINHGGTLSTPGMLFVNRCSWAHCVRESARLLRLSNSDVLSVEEREALDGTRSPHGVIVPETVV
jgi:phosphoketolase